MCIISCLPHHSKKQKTLSSCADGKTEAPRDWLCDYFLLSGCAVQCLTVPLAGLTVLCPPCCEAHSTFPLVIPQSPVPAEHGGMDRLEKRLFFQYDRFPGCRPRFRDTTNLFSGFLTGFVHLCLSSILTTQLTHQKALVCAATSLNNFNLSVHLENQM